MGAPGGPLRDHRSYLTHIALANCMDYLRVKNEHAALPETPSNARYREFRYFLNAVESLDRILDYFYYENADRLPQQSLTAFRQAVYDSYAELAALAERAEDYRQGATAAAGSEDDGFVWPLAEDEALLDAVLRFWLGYQNEAESRRLELA